jgi:cation diffusion facilitator CzcD-associated flavoprotein CzcO
MENPAVYDVLIVGGGQAGTPLAYKLAAEGGPSRWPSASTWAAPA